MQPNPKGPTTKKGRDDLELFSIGRMPLQSRREAWLWRHNNMEVEGACVGYMVSLHVPLSGFSTSSFAMIMASQFDVVLSKQLPVI